jgi:hypothetical protein
MALKIRDVIDRRLPFKNSSYGACQINDLKIALFSYFFSFFAFLLGLSPYLIRIYGSAKLSEKRHGKFSGSIYTKNRIGSIMESCLTSFMGHEDREWDCKMGRFAL